MPERARLLADTHAHYYDGFPLSSFLHGAARNLRSAATELGLSEDVVTGCLALLEIGEGRSLERLRDRIGAGAAAGWSIAVEGDADCFAARHEGAPPLLLYFAGGRQIVSAERLEVLMLGARSAVPSGLAAAETLRRVAGAGALPVLPWGFGKWWLGRGRCVRRLLADPSLRPLCLGDTSVRPRGGPRPPLFRRGEAAGIVILAGSDPLPLKTHASAAGRYGSLIQGSLDAAAPSRSFAALLGSLEGTPPMFGRRAGAAAFLLDQAALRRRGRGPGADGAGDPGGEKRRGKR